MSQLGPPVGRSAGEVVADLAGCGVMSDASPADRAELSGLLRPGRARGGTVLMRRGDGADSFLLLTSGSARVDAGDPSLGTVFVAPEGSILGEIALLMGTPHRATVTALTDVQFLVGDRQAFRRLLAIPDVGDRIVREARQRLAAGLPPVPLSLRDGTIVELRPVVPDDGQRVLQGAARSSADTLYRRFLRPGWPPARDLRYLADADYVHHFAWVALDRAAVPVGEASFFRTAADPTEAEISFWLPDDLQGRGLGSLLMGALAVAARRGGITRFVADVLADNAAMRAVLLRAGVRWGPVENGVVHGVAPVPHPEVFGLDPQTVTALGALVDEVGFPEGPSRPRPAPPAAIGHADDSGRSTR